MTAAADLPFSGTVARSSLRAPLRTAPVVRRRPALELVAPGRPDSPRAPFVAVVVSLLVAGLLGLLVLNTVLAQDAFALHTLTQDGRELADREQSLAREVEGLRSPQALAAKAVEQGMVQAGPPAFLLLPEGVVRGEELPALAPGEVRADDGSAVPEPEPEPGPAATSEDTSPDDGTTDDTTAEDDR